MEYDVNIIITEQGVATCSGKRPKERAPRPFENRGHPDYKKHPLWDYPEAV